MSGAFEPVEDVGAAGVVNLVERVSVRLLDGHGVTAETDYRSLMGPASGSRATTKILKSLQTKQLPLAPRTLNLHRTFEAVTMVTTGC